MTKTNLLPWREKIFAKQQKNLILSVTSVMFITLIILLSINEIIAVKILNTKKYQEFLMAQIKEITLQIARNKIKQEHQHKLLQLLTVRQKILRHQQQLNDFFASLPKIMPKEIYLTSVLYKNNKIILTGNAAVQLEITTLMSQLESMPEVGAVKLKNLNEAIVGKKDLSFQLAIGFKQ